MADNIKVYVEPDFQDVNTIQNGYEFLPIKRSNSHVSCKDIKTCPYGHWCGTCMYRDNLRSENGFRKSEEESGIFDWCELLHVGESRQGWITKGDK